MQRNTQRAFDFPIAEPRKAVARQVAIDPQGPITNTEEHFTEWRFHSKDRTKTLTVQPKAVVAEYQKYETYEILKKDYSEILEQLGDATDNVQPLRVGLRYVNSIELDEPNPTDWSEYIAQDLLSLFSFPEEQDRRAMTRVFHVLEMSFDSFRLCYRLGMHNPDYPAPIRQKVFVLDLDAYTDEPEDYRSIGRLLDNFHSKIQDYFERSIREPLRKRMKRNE